MRAHEMNNAIVGLVMITCGVGLAAGGIFVLIRRPPDLTGSAVAVARNPRPGMHDSSMEAPTKTPRERGEEFEKWVVKRLRPNYFTIKEWRSDKYVDGIYAKSSEKPDLEIEFRLRDVRANFAIECKWRKSFDQGKKPSIEWATERQIANYQQFSRATGMPVFVVIGIGGNPETPAELYLINLNKLRFPRATADYLAKFRRGNVGADFFYDYKKSGLR